MSSYSDFANAASDILTKKGDALATAKANSAATWGNTIANLGDQIPKQVQQAMKDAAARRQQQQIQQIFAESGDDLHGAVTKIRAINPALALSFQKELDSADEVAGKAAELKARHQKELRDFGLNTLATAKNESDWASGIKGMHDAGLDVSWVDPVFTPDAPKRVNEMLMTPDARGKTNEPTVDWVETVDEQGNRVKKAVPRVAGTVIAEPPKEVPPPAPFTLGAGQTRYDADGNEIASVPKDTSITPYQQEQLRLAAARLALERKHMENDAPIDIQPNTKEYRIAQDMAYGKITMADFNRMYGRAASNANLKASMYDTARQLNPNFNPAAFEIGFKLASSPKVQQQLTSLDNVIVATPDMIKYSDAAKRTGVGFLNSMVNKAGYQVGGKQYSNFHLAQIAYADELSGALGYGSATDMSREMGFNLTDGNLSPEKFADGMQTVVLPFIRRKRDTLLKGMGVYGQPGGSPGADAAQQDRDRSQEPSVGQIKTFPNGNKGRWDGKGWELVK